MKPIEDTVNEGSQGVGKKEKRKEGSRKSVRCVACLAPIQKTIPSARGSILHLPTMNFSSLIRKILSVMSFAFLKVMLSFNVYFN